jgi:hypothetical protein
MQAGVDKWEASGFLGMSVEMLDRVYGHHLPSHLRVAAHAICYGRRRQSLAETWPATVPADHYHHNTLISLVADAIAFEPVSTPKFPANREKNREFSNFGPSRGSETAIRSMIQRTWSEIPYSTEQGIFAKEQGI